MAVAGLLIAFPLLSLSVRGLAGAFPAWASLPPCASILFILCGCSLACRLSGRYRAGFLCAAVVFTLASAAALGQALGRDYGIGDLLFPAGRHPFPGRPEGFSPNAGLCFLPSSFALAVMNRPGLFLKAGYPVGLLGSMVSALGGMGVLGYLFGVPAAYGWGARAGMAFFSCLAFWLLGLAVMVLAWKANEESKARVNARFMAICIAVGISSASLVFWRALMLQERRQLERFLDSEMEILRSELRGGMRIRFQALERMGQRWEIIGPPTRRQWEADAGLNVRHYPGFEAVAWADTGLTVRWAAPAGRIDGLLGRPAAGDSACRRALRRALSEGNLQVSPTVGLPWDGEGFVAFRPVKEGGRWEGVLVGILGYRGLFGEIVPASILNGFEIGIYEGGRAIYPRTDPFRPGERWVRSGSLEVGSTRWDLRIRPNQAQLDEQLSSLPHMVLAGGILIALLMAASVHYGQGYFQHAARLLQSHRELEESRESFANIVDRNADGIIVAQSDGTVRFANPAAAALLGKPQAELIGSRFPLALEPGRTTELRLESGTGAKVVEMTVAHTGWEGKSACLAALRDVSEPARIREALRQSERRLRRLVESNIVSVFFIDAQGCVREGNDSFLRLLGYDRGDLESGKVAWLDLSPPGYLEVTRRMMREVEAKGVSGPYEHWCLRKDGRRVWTIAATSSLGGEEGGAVAYLVDIDARKAAEEALRKNEEQLRQAQKMEAVGRLAGGVAHDFNNLLTAINGYSEILLASLGEGDPHRSAVEEIKKAGERAAALTKQLLAFSRKQVVVPKVLEANAVVSDMVNLVRRLIGESFVLEVKLDPEAGWFKADVALVQQVLLNLAINSRDAMPRGGRLVIETGREEIEEAGETRKGGVGFHLEAPGGSYVTLTVRDSGMGMDEAVLSHLFEPFFSTKERGKGTGLGLSTVYGVVKQFHGAIKVASRKGEGTAMIVYLPRVEADAKASVTRPEQPLPPPGRGKESILLVEDEEAVRKMARAILEEKGYAVATAADGMEAITWFRDHREEVDLLLTDIVMPGMSGRELADLAREMKPDLRVVFISGYTDDEGLQKDLDAGTAFQAKPFTPEALLRTVRGTLDAAYAVPARPRAGI